MYKKEEKVNFMHFITKIVTEQPDETLHKHFVKFGKGVFDGPIISIDNKRKNISLACTFGYEDLLLDTFVTFLQDAEYKVSGVILTHEDQSNHLSKFNIPAMRYKAPLFKVKVNTQLNSEQIKELVAPLIYNEYLFLTIKAVDKKIKDSFKCKTTFPKPKEQEEGTLPKLDFAKTVIQNTETAIEWIVTRVVPEIQRDTKFKKIIVQNKFIISELKLPADKEKYSATELRKKAIRVGKIIRKITIDGQEIEKEYAFEA